MEYETQIAAVIGAALDKAGYQYRYMDANASFYMTFQLNNCRLQEVQVIVCIRRESLVIFCLSPVRVLPERLQDAALYLTGCNYDLVYGHFEMNPEDGEIRCRYMIDCSEHLPSMKTVEAAIHATVNTMERYGNGLLDVLYLHADPLAEVAKAEE